MLGEENGLCMMLTWRTLYVIIKLVKNKQEVINMTRDEHLKGCKERAMEYVKNGDLPAAWSSMVSDLSKHTETCNHPAIALGMMMMAQGFLNTPDDMTKFIEGFN